MDTTSKSNVPDNQSGDGHSIDNELSDKMQQMIDVDKDECKDAIQLKTQGLWLKTDSSCDNSEPLSEGVILTEQNDDQNEDFCITDLPSEVLIHIASFLDARSVSRSLYPVCKLFHSLFCDDRYWKTRISQRWKNATPLFEREDYNWQKACVEREDFNDMWTNPDETYHQFSLRQGFFAAVDVVHLMKGGQYLCTGSRDRHLNVFDLHKYDCDSDNPTSNLNIFTETKAHKGWVWSMASHENTLVTGSWDTYIRLWDFSDGNIQQASQKKMSSSILGLYYEPNFIAAGCFDKKLYIVDPRSMTDVLCKKYHGQPIICLTGDSKYIITGGEDKIISIYDRVAGKNYKRIETESFVNSLSYGDGQLWTGDKEGRIHVFDAQHGSFDTETKQTFDVGHTGRVTGLVHSGGGLLSCSSDKTVRVIEPSKNPEVIQTFTKHTGEVARIAYRNNIVATAGSDISVGVWLPRKQRTFGYVT